MTQAGKQIFTNPLFFQSMYIYINHICSLLQATSSYEMGQMVEEWNNFAVLTICFAVLCTACGQKCVIMAAAQTLDSFFAS